MLFTGSAVALITPFEGEHINIRLFQDLIHTHINAHTQALVIAGTTGESATLSFTEKVSLFRIAVETSQKQIKIIANIGTANTIESIALAKEAEAIGVDGLLVVTPYYNKPSQRGLKVHFEAIADATDLPLILYNVPSRTAIDLAIDTIVALAHHPKIIGIKEASDDLNKIKDIIASIPKDFALYAGNDHHITEVIRLGGHGVISVIANLFPNDVQTLCETTDQPLQDQMNAVNACLYIEPNPVPIKTAMRYQGTPVGHTRLPLIPMTTEAEQHLINAVKQYVKEVKR